MNEDLPAFLVRVLRAVQSSQIAPARIDGGPPPHPAMPRRTSPSRSGSFGPDGLVDEYRPWNYACTSRLRAVEIRDANDEVLAVVFNPDGRPCWGTVVGDPGWTEKVENSFRRKVLALAKRYPRAAYLMWQPGKNRGDREDLLK